MNALHPYIPQDRLRALSRGESLPDRTTGAALFADISGFTPLTEKLTQELGQRRGIEELTRQINAVYDALIGAIEARGGSVISFAGDAITCWFDEAIRNEELGIKNEAQLASFRAVAAALQMQAAMTAFPQLGLKVAVTTGPARRFVAGDPAIQLLDTIAGVTIARLAVAEHLAARGEVVIDTATATALAEAVEIREWRTDSDTQERFAAINRLTVDSEELIVKDDPSSLLTTNSSLLTAETLRPWILPAIYEREQSGHGSFLTELRPAVALFLRFIGLDYDGDAQAGEKLDGLIRRMQAVFDRYDGTLLDLIIGDKGSYIYAVFGAPTAHEDDAHRAVKAALALREATRIIPDLAPVQMGLSRGTVRTGAYGGTTRRTYGVLGDDVNLAARLMQAATPGKILISESIHRATNYHFHFAPQSPLTVKGKAAPLTVFTVTDERQHRAIRLQEPTYALPMVGRTHELQTITEKLTLAAAGKSQVIGIIADAGMGKSRLVAEVIRAARKLGFVGYGGACQSDAVNTPYQTWKSIWQAFFDVDPEHTLTEQMRLLEGEIGDHAPERVNAMPLLNVVLNLNIPDNEFTKTLEPQYRKSALRALLEDCLRAAAQDEPLLIVIEDLHWIDALSHDLLEDLARALSDSRVCFVLAYRPPQLARIAAPRLEALPNFTKIELHDLNHAEAEQAIRAKLAQLYPARGGALPSGLVDKLMARAQGNPFYLEELLNYLHDRQIDPANLDKIELPDSLHSLILSRIDRLLEHEKITLRVASIVGRLFRAEWLTGYYPDLGELPIVKTDLEQLADLDITPRDAPEPELMYLFRHIVTHEVTYETLPFATRARLHEQLAGYLEATYPDALPLDALAFHYGRSDNTAKQREYFQQAGEAAQAAYANETALEHYARLLPLLGEVSVQTEIRLKRGAVLELTGQWSEAEAENRAALALAETVADPALRAHCHKALGVLLRLRGEYAAALHWLTQAHAGLTTVAESAELAWTHIELGKVWVLQGEYGRARQETEAGLAQAQALGNQSAIAEALKDLGQLAWAQADHATARALYEQGLALYRALGAKRETTNVLAGLGNVALSQGDYGAARALYGESLALYREMGAKPGIAAMLGRLATTALYQGDLGTGQALLLEQLVLAQEMGDKLGVVGVLNGLGNIAFNLGNLAAARTRLEESLALSRALGDKHAVALVLGNVGNVARVQGEIAIARAWFDESLALRREMGEKSGIADALGNLADIAAEQQDYAQALALHTESLQLFRELGEKRGIAGALNNVGIVAVAQSDYALARTVHRESLTLSQAFGGNLLLAYNLAGLAAVALGEGAPQRTAQLAAVVEMLQNTTKNTLELGERRKFERVLEATRAALGEDSFATAWADGEKMTLEEAVAFALKESKPR